MAIPVVVPKLGMTMEEATLLTWLVPDGAEVHTGDVIFEAESEKISFEGEAEADGILRHVAREGETVPAGGVLAVILAPGEAMPDPAALRQMSAAPAATVQRQVAAAGPAAEAGRVMATPMARRLAAELGVDLSAIRGSGPGGRIVEADVRRAAEAKTKAPPFVPTVARRLPLRGARKVIAERMQRSLQQAAQFTLTLDVDMTEAMAARRQYVASYGGRLSTVDLVIKAVAEALRTHPRLNARIEGEEILELADINIGFAVALSPEGLIVPVVQQAAEKDLRAIVEERAALTDRARAGTLNVDDVAGATFTVSILGMIDSFTPIINPPEAAILGVGRVVEKPVVRQGEIVVRSMATLSLTVDHRLVDGDPAARFLRDVARLLEYPAVLFGEAASLPASADPPEDE